MTSARISSRGLRAALVAGALLLAGCASSATQSGGRPARQSCNRAGFELSLAIDSGGAPSPVLAAQAFGANGGAGGFTVPAGTQWRVQNMDGAGATLTGSGLTLHAVQLSDRTWAIDSGQACTEVTEHAANHAYVPTPRPRGSYLRLVLAGHRFPADGTPIRGYVEIHNTTGKPLLIANACDGWMGVGLTNGSVRFTAANGAVACAGAHLPVGVSRRPIAIATTYDDCLQPGGSAIPPSPPRCVGPAHNVMPLLPPGHYLTKAEVWGLLGRIAPPAPVAITLTRP